MTLQLPTSMRAAQGKDYGPIDSMVSVEDGVPLDKVVPKDHLLLKTHAVALAPGDCRVLSGKTRPLQGPPSFPYIPGGDVCGTVVKVPQEGPSIFKVGDRVAARFVSNGPIGGLAEYSLVSQRVCDKVPTSLSSQTAAALAGATPALCLADRIQTGDRVLIIGAGGGVGSHLAQFIRKKASFVAGVASTDLQRLLKPPYLYDDVVDYAKEDFLSKEPWKKTPFDVVVDLAGGTWPQLYKSKGPSIIKPASQGGRYFTTTPDKAVFEIHSMWAAMLVFLFPPLGRAIISRTWARRRLPKYTMAMSLPDEREIVTRTLEEADKGAVEAVIDGPYDFTTEGVRQALRRQETRHAKGKVVVTISKE